MRLRKIYDNWYTQTYIQLEIVKFLKERELAIFETFDNTKSVRNIKAHKLKDFHYWLMRYNFFERYYNVYYSLASFENGLPNFSPKPEERKKQTLEWNNNCHKYFQSYDLLLDIDAKSHEEMPIIHKQAKSLKTLFDKNKISYTLNFSGMGFHFILPYHTLSKNHNFIPADKGSIFAFAGKVMDKIKEKYVKNLDITVNDHRRVVKVPYSLAIYKPEDVYVCFPLSDDEFENFELDKMKPEYIIKHKKISFRGSLMRDGDGKIEEII